VGRRGEPGTGLLHMLAAGVGQQVVVEAALDHAADLLEAMAGLDNAR
jgi:hypothetical protein